MKALPTVVAALLFACPLVAHATPHFESCHERTGSNATLIVPAAAVVVDGEALESGDEIAVYTPDGVCAGWAEWDGANTALAVWEDNPMTASVDGFASGEAMRYAIWDASQSQEYGPGSPVEVTYDADYDDGVYQPDAVFRVASLAVQSPVANEPGAPVDFALGGNYPNPFTGRTTISYELPRDARVTLEVYNLLGHRVGVLVDEVRPAGRHEAPFEAQPHVASGVYVYRIQIDDFAAHGKMILVD